MRVPGKGRHIKLGGGEGQGKLPEEKLTQRRCEGKWECVKVWVRGFWSKGDSICEDYCVYESPQKLHCSHYIRVSLQLNKSRSLVSALLYIHLLAKHIQWYTVGVL